MKKKSNVQYAYSNRHNMPITINDKKKIMTAYSHARSTFDSLPVSELEEIQSNKVFDGKKITGSVKRALEDSLQYHKFTKLIKTEDETTAQA